MKTYFEAVADFETTTPDWKHIINSEDKANKQVRDYYKKHSKPEVYSWAIGFDKEYSKNIVYPKDVEYGKREDEDFKYVYGIDIYSFIEFMIVQNRDWKVFFHNLKGFDGRFILPVLTKLGFKKLNKSDESREELGKAIYGEDWKIYKPLPFEYQVSIEKNKKIYYIKMYIPNQDKASTKKVRCISFEDNLLMFNTSIKEMGKQLASHYNDDTRYFKGSIEYNKETRYNSVGELSGEQLEYLLQDVFILGKFRNLMSENLAVYGLSKDKWKRTQGATAVSDWKNGLGKNLITLNESILLKKTKSKGAKLYRMKKEWLTERQMGEFLIKQILPTNWLQQEDTFLKVYRWYTGGITKVNEKYRGVIVDDIKVLDIVSSYPTIMASELPCPVGEPVKEEEGSFHLYEVELLKNVANKEGLPFITQMVFTTDIDFPQISEQRKYLPKGTLLKMTSVEYERFVNYYDIKEGDVIKKTLYSFKTLPFNFLFGSYVDKWYTLKEEAKRNGNLFQKNFAKIMLNSLYGKFGTKIRHESYEFDSDNFEYVSKTEDSYNVMYLPIAIAITAYGRMKLVDAVDRDYEDFVYCDTDSLFIKDRLMDKLVEEGRIVIGKHLGNWELENEHNYKLLVRRAKQYLAVCQEHGRECECKIAFAGINFLVNDEVFEKVNGEEMSEELKTYRDTITFDDMIYGKKIGKQLVPMFFEDKGVVMYEEEKEIKPIWEYKPLVEQYRITKEDYLGAN